MIRVLLIVAVLAIVAAINISIAVLITKRHPSALKYVNRLASATTRIPIFRPPYSQNSELYLQMIRFTSAIVGFGLLFVLIFIALGILDFQFGFNPLGIPFYWGTIPQR